MAAEIPPRVSVVVPVFNEEECVPLLVRELLPALENLGAEVIVVDDGSTDATAERVRQHAKFRCLSIPRSGKSAALRRGVEEARSDIVVTIDADLQEHPRQIPELLDALSQGADMVTGYRHIRTDGLWSKKFPSLGYRLLVRLLFGWDFKDINCGFRVARRDLFRSVLGFEGSHRLAPLLVRLRGGTVREIKVEHRRRRCGKPKYQSARRLLEGLRNLLRLRLGLS